MNLEAHPSPPKQIEEVLAEKRAEIADLESNL
jgi:hypothetical protein